MNEHLLNHFVSARLFGREDDCRQGVCFQVMQDRVFVRGLLSDYICEPDAVIVPLANLYGPVLELAQSMGVTE